MADNSELGELYGTAGGRGTVAGWIGLAGAVTSLVLIAGVAFWGYKLLMRDVNGIPVVRALEGPMRVAPADPGGERMAHQGLTVNQVAATGEAGELSEELVLAPPEPELLEQDLAQGALDGQPLANLSDEADELVMEALEDDPESAEAGLVDAAMTGAETVAGGAVDMPVVVIPASVRGVSRSLRPPHRPAALVRRAPAAADPSAIDAAVAAAAEPETVEVAADSLPVGSRLVQLGAFDSVDLAREEWGRLADRFSDVMDGKSRVIQEATAGGQTFYRLRVAGFDDLADARRFCATLLADKTKPLCVPVATR